VALSAKDTIDLARFILDEVSKPCVAEDKSHEADHKKFTATNILRLAIPAYDRTSGRNPSAATSTSVRVPRPREGEPAPTNVGQR
jgi:hypothetical protein